MSKNDKKTGLLDKKKKGYDKVKEEEWIQLEEIKSSDHQAPYFSIQEQQQSFPYKPLKETPPPQYIKPQGTIINHPNIITMNGTSFKKVEKKQQPRKIKKSNIPTMQVACQFCTVLQNVPGNAQLYICGECQNMNQCEPLYGIFICGCCQTKVCYGFGVSEFIRCTKCGTINRVPTEPQKKYKEADENEKFKNISEQPIHKKQPELLYLDKDLDREQILVDFEKESCEYPQLDKQQNNRQSLKQDEFKFNDF